MQVRAHATIVAWQTKTGFVAASLCMLRFSQLWCTTCCVAPDIACGADARCDDVAREVDAANDRLDIMHKMCVDASRKSADDNEQIGRLYDMGEQLTGQLSSASRVLPDALKDRDARAAARGLSRRRAVVQPQKRAPPSSLQSAMRRLKSSCASVMHSSPSLNATLLFKSSSTPSRSSAQTSIETPRTNRR